MKGTGTLPLQDQGQGCRELDASPIPGTRKLERLEENLGAVNVGLTADDLREIDSAYSQIKVQGARLSEEHMKLIDRAA